MKTTKRKVISFFVLLMLSMTIIGPVHADGENDNSHLNDWLEGIRPVDTGEVTIKVNTPKVQKSENYNLSSNNKQNNKLPIDLLPSWMSQGDCINGKAGFIFFQSEIVNCETFTVKGSGMNKFSKQFFEEIIETRKEELLEKEKNDEINDISLSMDSILHTSEQTEGELSISSSGDNLDMENLVDDLAGSADESEDDILNLLGSFDLSTGENQEEVDVIETQEIISEIDSSTVVLNDGVDNEDNTGITNSGIVIGDVTSGEELKNQVDTVLQKFLNPDEYIAPVKKLEEVIEEDVIIKVEDKKGEIERDVSIDELFPNVYINSDINTFTESLFGPEVKNIMYGVEINNDLLSGISANYLAITLEKFREQKEIIEISDHELGDYQIFGLQGYHHYNSELKDLFEKFLDKKPSTDEINKVAQDLSAISFSFSTYTNRTVNLKTKNIFKNKLILDFQKLEKDYKNISKEATIRNFLLKR